MGGLKVAIVGFGNGWEKALPLKDKGFELWGLNDWREGFTAREANRWFQLHSVPYLEEFWPPWKGIQRANWLVHWELEGIEKPLYMHRRYHDLPGSVAFPKRRIEDTFPRGRYHCGSFDWMVAFAILEGAEEIRLYGVCLTLNGEPLSARACLEYWLGLAEGRGIKTHVESPDLFYTFQLLRSRRQYAWDESFPMQLVERERKVALASSGANRLMAKAFKTRGGEDGEKNG